jgi:hypothetical protein
MRLSLRRDRGKSYGNKLNSAVMETMEQRILLSVFTVTNTGDNDGINPAVGAGTGTLRQAIIDSDADTGQTNAIEFSIAGPGVVWTIEPDSPLPAITQSVNIDGNSQGGSGYAGPPLIELDGINSSSEEVLGYEIGSAALDFTASASNSAVEGLDINQFSGGLQSGVGIFLNGASNVVVTDNYIGIQVYGDAALPNYYGIEIDDGATGNIIGGTTLADRNVISGNAVGIRISDALTEGNIVEGNYIGTNYTITSPIPNEYDGIQINNGASDNIIGGTAAGAANFISDNYVNGIEIDGTSSGPQTMGNLVEGNYIGGNGTGVAISAGATDNSIGGPLPGAGNSIDYSYLGAGVEIGSSASDSATVLNDIRLNSIYENNGPGIDLAGFTSDSSGGPHSGPDDLQNFPYLSSATSNGSTTTVQGLFNSTPDAGFVLDFYSNSRLNPDGTEQGAIYLGSATVLTDGSGNATLNVTLNTSVTAGEYITATATTLANLPYGDTSEFAPPVPVTTTTDVLTASGDTVAATEGASFTGDVASFTDTNTSATLSNFSALINWGDGSSTSAGIIAANGSGGFNVVGTHTYLDFGTYATSVTITPTNGSAANPTGTANVVDAALIPLTTPIALGPSEGQPTGNVVVGYFSDADPYATVTNYEGSINWGDGSTATALAPANLSIVSQNATGTLFAITGNHTYTQFGQYQVSIAVTDDDGNPAKTGGSTATIDETTVNVADLPLTAGTTAISYKATEGSASGNVILGYFTDANPTATNVDYLGSINWGDGSTATTLSSSNIVAVSSSSAGVQFAIYGNHTYITFGTYLVTVNVTDDGGNPSKTGGSTISIAETTFTVPDAALTAGTTAIKLTATEGNASGNDIIGYFTDANPDAVAGDYTGSVNWGDGNTATLVAGNITQVSTSSAGVKFAVYGSHVFIKPGTYKVTVNVTDDNGNPADTGGSTATIKEATFQVADAPLTGYSVSGLTAMKNNTFTGVVATFLDHDPLAVTDDYTVKINWGDGAISANVIPTYNSTTGLWSVAGSHKYTKAGMFTITMTVIDDDGGQSAVVESQIKVIA